MDIRHTPARQWTLRVVKLSKDGLTADAVIRFVRKQCPGSGRSTIFRNLNFLAKRGEIYEFESEDGKKRYIGHSFHEQTFRCQRCGETKNLSLEDLIDAVKYRLRSQPLFYSRLQVAGLCPSCVKTLRTKHQH